VAKHTVATDDGTQPPILQSFKRVARTLALLGAWFMTALPVHAAEEEAHVLILNGYDPYLPANLMMDSGMRANLANETARRIVLYSESLDAGRGAVESRDAELVALFTKKYGAQRIDVVVTVTKPALDFFKRHGEQLWPGARLVFHGIPDPADEAVPIPPGAVGIMNRDDVGGTIDIARRLQPTARRILVIAGVGAGDLQVERRVRRLAPTVAGTATMEFISGLPLPELLARVASEPADTIIMFLTQFLDRDGRPYRPPDVAQAMSSVSAAPVYGLYETYVGRGVAAGSMTSYEDRGRLVGQLVRETLAGTRSVGSPVFTIASRCVADARALERWSLDAQRLPAGCDVRFAERPLWRQYWWQIALALAIIVGQAMLIMALLGQHRRRRVAEAESQKRLAEMAHMNRRVSLGELSASIAHELNQPLGAIHNNAGAAEMLIKADPPKLQEVAEILADIKRDDQRASDVIARIRRMMRKTEFEVQDIDLNEAIGEAMQMVAADATVKGVSLKLQLEPGMSKVRADRVEVQQVILNLVLNAIEAMHDQHAQRRELVIRSRRANDKEVEISVADSGPGIPDEMLPRIFEPFVTSKGSGMGLGLAISRTIVEAHGGQIRAENSPEGGAVFRFTLPLA
jgi:signal transduction histidine kinase